MKNLILGIIALSSLSITDLVAQNKPATINCTVTGPKGSGINLYKIKDGQAQSLGFQRPNPDGNCSFQVDEDKEGIYYFAKAGGKGADYKYVLYLKAGDTKQVNLFLGSTSVDYDSCVIQKPNKETQILQTWTTDFNQYCKVVQNRTFESHQKYADFEKKAHQFLKANHTSNTYFNSWLKDKVTTDVQYLRAANFFRFGKRLNAGYDSSATVVDFYKPLLNKKIVSDPALLRSDHGQDLLNYVFGYWKLNQDKAVKNLAQVPFSENIPLITNNDVRVAYIVTKMKNITMYEDFGKQVQPYKELFVTATQKAAYDKKYEDLYLFAKGTDGYNFKLKDVNDQEYTLAGFKGKVVVIDIWAMWCAPCLAEKPVMEKIAEELKDHDDLVFVGVSVDGLNRRDNWKSFVERKGFTSIELLSNATESIHHYYKVEGIPRFLIFDRQGKIVTVDAPRPSTPGFKKIIEATLAKK